MTSALAIMERTPEQQAQFELLLREVKELRPLPAIALRLIAMSEDRRFSAQDLADTIRTDQALTLKILRLANSPIFGMPRRITSLREAIVLLGFREVRSMALGACVVDHAARDRLVEARLDYEVLWTNSLVVAHFARVLAALETVDREDAFTAGIVHNVRRLALAQHRPKWMAQAVDAAAERSIPVHQAELEQFGFTDAQVGSALASAWSFPQGLVEAAERHQWPLSDIPDRRGLDSLVARARRFARAHGISDGVDVVGSRLHPDVEWQMPRVVQAMGEIGGVEGVIERAKAYVYDTV
ncbi:MAG: HDOD domain-containing protein [Chloroflexi bacterium]|nr:HDOD domain-containing protein [Chloroflexota bacterium]